VGGAPRSAGPEHSLQFAHPRVRIAIHAPRAKPMKEPAPKPGRQRGSARFATYYKVQWYDTTSLCWLDIQQLFPSIAAARAAHPPRRRCRVMEVTP
jgi:hypothetical protein